MQQTIVLLNDVFAIERKYSANLQANLNPDCEFLRRALLSEESSWEIPILWGPLEGLRLQAALGCDEVLSAYLRRNDVPLAAMVALYGGDRWGERSALESWDETLTELSLAPAGTILRMAASCPERPITFHRISPSYDPDGSIATGAGEIMGLLSDLFFEGCWRKWARRFQEFGG